MVGVHIYKDGRSILGSCHRISKVQRKEVHSYMECVWMCVCVCLSACVCVGGNWGGGVTVSVAGPGTLGREV